MVGPHDSIVRLAPTAETLGLIVRSVRDDRVTFLAASIAFYAILSIFPILLLLLAVGSLIVGESFGQTVLDQVAIVLTPEAQSIVEDALQGESGRGGASVVGLAVLLWSSLRLFRGLDVAFSQIYTQSPDPDYLATVRNALLVFGSIGIAVIVLVLVRGVLGVVALPPIAAYLSPLFIFVTIAIVFFPMYYVFPNHPQHPLAVLPGTLFAALGWTVLGELFGIYAANAGTYALFGLIGAVLLLLMWFYFGAIIVLVGAVINAVQAGKYRPEDGWE